MPDPFLDSTPPPTHAEEPSQELPVPTPAEDETTRLTAERDEAQNLYLRTLAEFQNFKRRSQQERIDLQKTASQELVKDLLPVLDNFERTLVAAGGGASIDSIVEGIAAVERQLRGVLEKRHVTRIATVGQAFDPHFHEPLGTDPTDESPEDTVTVEIEAGYRIGDKVLRPARVRVAKKP